MWYTQHWTIPEITRNCWPWVYSMVYDITLQRLTHPQIAQLSYTCVIYLCLKSQDPRSAYGFTMFYIYFILLPSWQTWRFSVLKPTQHGSIVTIPRYGCSPLEDVLPPNKLYKTPKRMVLSSSKIIGNSPCQTFQVPLISTLHLDVEKMEKNTLCSLCRSFSCAEWESNNLFHIYVCLPYYTPNGHV